MAPTTAQAPAATRANAKWRAPLGSRRWLQSQIERWTQAQLISPQQGRGILAHYPDEPALRRQWGMRGVIGLASLAAVLLAMGAVLPYCWMIV